MNKSKCAVYVRKSTEKGLEQDFNSLHNQEEACKNYILSQAFNGWEYCKTYTDGGISGGTMKRPALQEMMADIKKGLIQVVVTYKVDRLSRSIMDFHNMMQEFDRHECSFVSITQAFDTSTSMGKLTLNMLLSFAQFEREVSSERIRDKIAASKKKGYWTGGPVPFGYDVKNKKLIPNVDEVPQIRFIFEKYLELKSVRELREILINTDIRTKKWTNQEGEIKGGKIFSSSMLARILNRQVYIGRIESKKEKESYPGQHKAIIDKKLFDKVQTCLRENQQNNLETYMKNSFLLSNKVYDTQGRQLKNYKGTKNRVKKYRYYALKGKYLPAGDIEEITIQMVRELLDCPLTEILNQAQAMEFRSIDFTGLSVEKQVKLMSSMIHKVICNNNEFTYFINLEDLSYLKPFKKANYINIINQKADGQMYVSEDKKYLIIKKTICINNQTTTTRYIGQDKKLITIEENKLNLIRALCLGWRYGKMIIDGKTVRKIGTTEHKADRTIYKYLNLCYLSPNIINDIMESQVPAHVNLQLLFEIASKYTGFKEQENAFYQGK